MKHLIKIRKNLPTFLAWAALAIILLVLIPMLYPVNLPLQYHVYHFILFWILFGVYYLNIRWLIPNIFQKRGKLLYFVSIVFLGFVVIMAMDGIEEVLNVRKLLHQQLNPNEPYVAKRNIFIPIYLAVLLSFIFIAGAVVRLVKKWNTEEKNNLLLREEKSRAELNTLKAQIQPHFFFNTLNTIHALTHSDVGKSQEALLKLSKMMRFTMNEDNRDVVTLKEEIDFVKNYIDLMKHRLGTNIQVQVHFPEVPDHWEIAPMILLTFVENCFKHGISTDEKCVVKIKAKLDQSVFTLHTENGIFRNATSLNSSGIGLENTLKRLDILYPEKYHYQFLDQKDVYYSELKINLL